MQAAKHKTLFLAAMLRTLVDVASSGEVPLADLKLAFSEATRSGKITRAEIAGAKMVARACH